MERVAKAPRAAAIWGRRRRKEGLRRAPSEGRAADQAPRLFWENFVGPIPDGYTVRSRKLPACVGKACCNPEHHRLLGPVVGRSLDLQRAAIC